MREHLETVMNFITVRPVVGVQVFDWHLVNDVRKYASARKYVKCLDGMLFIVTNVNHPMKSIQLIVQV